LKQKPTTDNPQQAKQNVKNKTTKIENEKLFSQQPATSNQQPATN
jgi:hypothetical protein